MSFANLFRRTRKAPRRGPSLPRLEALEDRALPSTFTVTNLLDNGSVGSLRWAVGQANAHPGPDAINFAPGLHGTIALSAGQLNVTDSVTVNGPGANQLTVSGSNASRVFDVSGSGTSAVIRDLTVADGRASGTTATGPLGDSTLGGGILDEGAALTLSRVTVTGNQAVGSVIGAGGGVASISGAALTVLNSTFTGNRAGGTAVDSPGGGILSDGASTLVVQGSTFSGNRAIDGGAVAVLGGSQATISSSTFSGNLARGNDGTATSGPTTADNGGAVWAADESLLGDNAASLLNVSDSAFVGNRAVGGTGGPGGAGGQGAGGALAVSGGQTVLAGGQTVANVSDCVFVGNLAVGGDGGAGGGNGGVGAGGAISQANGTLNLSDSKLAGNRAVGGAGAAGAPGGDGGSGGIGRGGAIVHTVAGSNGPDFHPVSNLSGVVITGNQALGGTGGAAGAGGVGGDGGPGQGGGVRALLGTITVADSVLAANEATGGAGGAGGGNGGSGQGGGFLTAFGVTATLLDTAVTRNEAEGGAGAVGGDGLGGGLFNGGPLGPFSASSLTLVGCTVTLNDAEGVGGGSGVGGGVYNLGAFSEVATVIARNHASTSNDDVFP